MEELYHRENNVNDIDINNLDIIHLFGKEALEDIQKKISGATGLACITVDYKGDPVTVPCSFTQFCQTVRQSQEACTLCHASDAFGAIQAAVTRKPSVYFCPCGLLEAAIPIIIKGHYLGGFIGGQVRCEDAPSDVARLENVMKQSVYHQKEKSLEPWFESINIYPYEKFVHTANLISIIINQLSEKIIIQQMQITGLEQELSHITAQYQKDIMDRKLKNTEISCQSQLNPYFLKNTLTSISNMAVIEDAEKTTKMLNTFIEYIKQLYISTQPYPYLFIELENIERYLEMQKIKMGDALSYCIQIPENMKLQRIPGQILLPYIEYAVFYGISLKRGGGDVIVTGSYQGDDVCIIVEDNGPGYSEEELIKRFEKFDRGHEGDSIGAGITNARLRLKALYGGKYDVVTENMIGKGRRCQIIYPKHCEERIG